jgi:hypothetical protein
LRPARDVHNGQAFMGEDGGGGLDHARPIGAAVVLPRRGAQNGVAMSFRTLRNAEKCCDGTHEVKTDSKGREVARFISVRSFLKIRIPR